MKIHMDKSKCKCKKLDPPSTTIKSLCPSSTFSINKSSPTPFRISLSLHRQWKTILSPPLSSPTPIDPSPPPSPDTLYSFLSPENVFHVPETSTIDPFRNHTNRIEGLYEWIEMLVCLPIAAVKLVVYGFSLAVGYIATRCALFGWKDIDNPMPRWRCGIMWITRVSARCILFSFGYQWIRQKGKPAPREVAPIVVSNHVSYIEPIFFFYELFPTIVASESHDSMPFVGTIIRAMQVIYVNRFSHSSRKHAVNEIKRKASSEQFPRVLIFPEGTTSNGRCLLSFQLGAFIPRYPVQPIVVRYPHVHFDQSWGLIGLAKLMFRMFMQFHNFMEFGISLLPAIPNLNQNEIHRLLTLFDTDCDGKISKDDFFTCMRRNPLLIALFFPLLMHNLSPSSHSLGEEMV